MGAIQSAGGSRPGVRPALLDYLLMSKRMYVLGTDAPRWIRHDHPKLAAEALTSHALVKNLKRYAWASIISI